MRPRPSIGNVLRGPHFELAVFPVGGGALRLHCGVGDKRILVRGLDHLGRRLEHAVDIAIGAHGDRRRGLKQFGGTLGETLALCAAPGPRSQSTLSCLRACCACHHVSATMATPASMPGSQGMYAAGAMLPSMIRTWRTPGSVLIASTLAVFTLPAKTGALQWLA